MLELDSLIVACGSENFKEQFFSEKAWYPVSISSEKLCNIKYLFAYQKSPIASITHMAEVESILLIEGTKKYKIIFKNTPIKINNIPMGKDQRNVPQNPRYANSQRVHKAINMDNIF